MTAAECCSTCKFYLPRSIDVTAAERALRAGVLLPEGECRRYPQTLIKRRGEYCGEHKPREGE